MEKESVRSKRKSYLIYSRKSLLVDKRSYIILFVAVACMVVMSMNIIIYNSSVSRGENDTVIRQYGDYHASFKEVTREDSLYIDMYSHIRETADIMTVCKVANPNAASDISYATLAGYTDGLDCLFIQMENGTQPSAGQIMISDEISRAFSLYVGDKTEIRVRYSGYVHDREYTVSGIFTSSEAAEGYIFISEDELNDIMSIDTFSGSPLYDKYISFDTDFAPKIKRYTDELIEYVNDADEDEKDEEAEQYDDDEDKEEIRSLYLNGRVVSLKKFYEKPSFLITIIISILPSSVAMLVFVMLDIFKSMKELSVLSMIGTTPQQFFKLLIVKYFLIYLVAFPTGVALSCLIMRLLCLACDNMNNNETIYLSYSVDAVSVALMFVLCLGILTGITYYVSKKTTAVSYTQMVSSVKNMNNVFVSSSAEWLLKGGKHLYRTGVAFFARNRRVNSMFCCVIAVLMAVFAYFSMVLSQQVGSIPVAVDRGDITVTGDEAIGIQYSTISGETVEKLRSMDGVKRIMASYYIPETYNDVIPLVRLDPAKTVSKPKTKLTGTLQKSYITDVNALSCEKDRAEFLYGRYVVSGSLDDVFDDSGRVAVFVHDWQNSAEYYRAGDTIDLRASYVTENGKAVRNNFYEKYTVGAVLYDPLDQYENVDVIRILCDNETYKTLTYMTEPSQLEILLEDNSEQGLAAASAYVRGICKTDGIRYTVSRTEYLQARAQMISSVMFYSVLWIMILGIAAMLLHSMTDYLLVSRKGVISTLNMIGCGAKGLFEIFGVEFICCGVCSALLGACLSGVVFAVYSRFVSIPYNGYIYAILALAIILPSLLCLLVPSLTARRFLKKNYN